MGDDNGDKLGIRDFMKLLQENIDKSFASVERNVCDFKIEVRNEVDKVQQVSSKIRESMEELRKDIATMQESFEDLRDSRLTDSRETQEGRLKCQTEIRTRLEKLENDVTERKALHDRLAAVEKNQEVHKDCPVGWASVHRKFLLGGILAILGVMAVFRNPEAIPVINRLWGFLL